MAIPDLKKVDLIVIFLIDLVDCCDFLHVWGFIVFHFLLGTAYPFMPSVELYFTSVDVPTNFGNPEYRRLSKYLCGSQKLLASFPGNKFLKWDEFWTTKTTHLVCSCGTSGHRDATRVSPLFGHQLWLHPERSWKKCYVAFSDLLGIRSCFNAPQGVTTSISRWGTPPFGSLHFAGIIPWSAFLNRQRTENFPSHFTCRLHL